MQQQMRQRMVANQLAMARERMYWWSSFYGLCLVGLTAGYGKLIRPMGRGGWGSMGVHAPPPPLPQEK